MTQSDDYFDEFLERTQRPPIATIEDPTHGGITATKVDPVSGKTVVDREAEEARIEGAVSKAQEYIEETGKATPGVPAEGQAKVGYRSDEETDRLMQADEVKRAIAYEEGKVDPIEGLEALEESDDPVLEHNHRAKAMRDAQAAEPR